MTEELLRNQYGLDALERRVRSFLPDFVAQAVPSIDSTNTELMRRAKAGQLPTTLLIAQRQSAGKGRMGKPWQSAIGRSLVMSLGMVLNPKQWHGLSLVLGMVVAQEVQALRSPTSALAKAQLGLKWPNDVWLMDDSGQGRKLAGILIETAPVHAANHAGAASFEALSGRYVVIGIGLNLRPIECNNDMAFSVPPVSLQELSAGVDEAYLIDVLVVGMVQALQLFEKQGFAPWQASFAKWDVLRGRQVLLSDGRTGVVQGVSPQGELHLATDQGDEWIMSAEVSVRPVSS